MDHPLTLSFLTLHDITPPDAVRAAAEAGFSGIGFRLLPAALAGEAAYPLLRDDKLLEATRKALAETGIAAADIEIARLGPATDAGLFDELCARGAALGARHLLVAGDETDPVALRRRFADVAQVAARHGLTADLEFMPYTGVPDLASALAVLADVDAPNGGVLIDSLHSHRSGVTNDEIAATDRAMINYVQLCDGPVPFDPSKDEVFRIARTARNFPGEGGIPMTPYIKAIPEGVTISVEVPDRGLAAAATPLERARRAFDTAQAALKAAGRNVRRNAPELLAERV